LHTSTNKLDNSKVLLYSCPHVTDVLIEESTFNADFYYVLSFNLIPNVDTKNVFNLKTMSWT